MNCSKSNPTFFSICTIPLGYPTVCHLTQCYQSDLRWSEGIPWHADVVRKILREVLVIQRDGIVLQIFSLFNLKAMHWVTGTQQNLRVSEMGLFRWQQFTSVMLGDMKCCPQQGRLYGRLPRNKPNQCNHRRLFFTYSQATAFSTRYFCTLICYCPLN